MLGDNTAQLLFAGVSALVFVLNFFTCDRLDNLNCSDFTTASHANAHLWLCIGDEDRLDNDNDGEACETLP